MIRQGNTEDMFALSRGEHCHGNFRMIVRQIWPATGVHSSVWTVVHLQSEIWISPDISADL